MFLHQHPYPPFIPKNATKLIVGTLPPPRFSVGLLKKGDVNFCYGSINGLLWKVIDSIFNLNLVFENSERAINQRKEFLINHKIGICDIVESCYRQKMDASDLGMTTIKLRNILYYIQINKKVKTLLLTGGNSKNGPEYHLRKLLKKHNIAFINSSKATPKEHYFYFDNRKIKVISLIAPSGSANRAIGSNLEYKLLKKQNPNFNTFDFRVLQYQKYL